MSANAPHISHSGAAASWQDQRSAGVLLHVSSLPTPYGIGDMGKVAYEFAHRLANAGQRFWQILPLNPTNAGAGESPYFSSSAFAGNPLLIDLEALHSDGLLEADDLSFPTDLDCHDVEFERVRPLKLAAIRKAAARLVERGLPEHFHQWQSEQAHWLDDYALFTELERLHPHQSWSDWPAALRDRDASALDAIRTTHAAALLETKVFQYFFFQQWQALKDHCNELGLLLFGDMPIYVSFDSADVWSHPHIFKLGEDKRPTMVSGVPPDYFSATGQLWNNPVYDWEALKATQYRWWVERMNALFARFDIVRIDHFRGLVQYWEVPAGAENAIGGSWQDVPTYDFFDTLYRANPDFPVVAEDLGVITPDVVEVKDHYGLPGMLVLHFAFYDDNSDNPYKPENHSPRSLVYLGTHDNTTTRAWLDEADEQIRGRYQHYLNAEERTDSVDSLLGLLMRSSANIAIISAQDLLDLPARARMNNPSTPSGNWSWRLSDEEYAVLPFDKLAALTEGSQRAINPHNS